MVLIRDHGPKIANARLVLHTLRSYMDDSGFTFVGQATIATAACLSKPTVRKMLTVAWEAQWIGVSSQGRSGQGWRHYEYRACIPDTVEIPEKHEALVSAFGAKYGDEVDTDTHPDIAKVGKPLSHVPPPIPGAKKPEGGKNGGSNVGKSTTEGGKNAVHKVGNGLSPKSSSEEVLSKLSSEHEGAIASDRTTCVENLNSKRTKEPDRRADKSAGRSKDDPEAERKAREAAEARAAADRAATEASHQAARELRAERIRKAIAALPTYGDTEIAKIAGVSIPEVQQVRSRA